MIYKMKVITIYSVEASSKEEAEQKFEAGKGLFEDQYQEMEGEE